MFESRSNINCQERVEVLLEKESNDRLCYKLMNIDTCGLLDPRMSSTPRTKVGRPESPSNQFFKSEKKKKIINVI